MKISRLEEFPLGNIIGGTRLWIEGIQTRDNPIQNILFVDRTGDYDVIEVVVYSYILERYVRSQKKIAIISEITIVSETIIYWRDIDPTRDYDCVGDYNRNSSCSILERYVDPTRDSNHDG